METPFHQEILLNALRVTSPSTSSPDQGSHKTKPKETFEFIVNEALSVMHCIRILSHPSDHLEPIIQPERTLAGILFELRHVRVNPEMDNTRIVETLKGMLSDIGVTVRYTPSPHAMAVCYKPLGEITENVRFYTTPSGKLVFLSPAMRPKLVP